MAYKNNKGVTLVELLASLAISVSIMAVVSGVLFQSVRSEKAVDTHVNLRQEANLILAMFSSAQTSPDRKDDVSDDNYIVNYRMVNTATKEWVMTIGSQEISNRNYFIGFEIVTGGINYKIDPESIETFNKPIKKKQKLNIKNLQLVDKNNPNNKFEISTIISRYS